MGLTESSNNNGRISGKVATPWEITVRLLHLTAERTQCLDGGQHCVNAWKTFDMNASCTGSSACISDGKHSLRERNYVDRKTTRKIKATTTATAAR